MGLAAHDVLAQLTLGRGGRYIRTPEGLTYIASGEEPKIYMYSRSSIPFRARGRHVDNAAIGTGPFFMTESVVNEMAACGFRSTTGEAISYKSDRSQHRTVPPLPGSQTFRETEFRLAFAVAINEVVGPVAQQPCELRQLLHDIYHPVIEGGWLHPVIVTELGIGHRHAGLIGDGEHPHPPAQHP